MLRELYRTRVVRRGQYPGECQFQLVSVGSAPRESMGAWGRDTLHCRDEVGILYSLVYNT